jgi:5,10-methylenetetrahydrofolate reductase
LSDKMRRPFRSTLQSTPLVLEIVPPSRRSSDKAVTNLVDRVREAVRTLGTLDGLNLPQVLDENHMGQPFLRNMDPRDFARRLGDDLGVDPIVNNVVAHTPSADAVRKWTRESLDAYGLRSFVLVGGTRSRIRYPGPPVLEADRILRSEAAGRDDVALGNITIPDRDNEVERLVEKTRAGCDFFTTQVIFEAEPMATVLRAYGKRCAAQGLAPATVLLSFAPVSDYQDLEFLVWLGAIVTPRTEEALFNATGTDPGRASIEVARTLWSHLRAAAAQSRPAVPLGVNIEEVSLHNLDLAVRMAAEFPAWRDLKAVRASHI